MEKWELDFNWLKIRHFVKDTMKVEEMPNLETILFLLGLQELGIIVTQMSKERKVEVTTLGMCLILSQEGYFVKEGYDDEGWPVWKELKPFTPENDIEEDKILKELTIRYFEEKYDL